VCKHGDRQRGKRRDANEDMRETVHGALPIGRLP
jgi:hypothetical protein